MPELYDVIVIGAGIVGSLVARTLSRYQLRILLLEKNSDVAEGTTKANTAIVHAGYDTKPGSNKARLNLAGNRMYDNLCGELDAEFLRCGTFVVAVNDTDIRTLESLYQRGMQNGVSGLEILNNAETRRHEPSLAETACASLYAATGGIVDPFQLGIGAAESAVINGTELLLETEVTGLLYSGRRISGVETTRGQFYSRWVVIAAGLWADELMHKAGLDSFDIKPRKGEYFVLDRRASDYVHTVLFPCPTPVSKGIMVTRTVHGNVLLGPNANTVPEKDDLAVTASGLDEVWSGAMKLIPGLDKRDTIRSFAGLRASGTYEDFVIEMPSDPAGLVVLAGIESPGLTAAPAIAEEVAQMLHEAGLALQLNPHYKPIRRAVPRFTHLARTEQEKLLAIDPRFATIVCRCEMISEGEVAAACHEVIPARTYDGLKRRTRLGAGRCQGAFDLPLVLGIIARELGVSPCEITQKGSGSEFLARLTKEADA